MASPAYSSSSSIANNEGDRDYFRELGQTGQKQQISNYFTSQHHLFYLRWSFEGACLQGSVSMANWLCRQTPLHNWIITDITGKEFMQDCFFMAAEKQHVEILRWMIHNQLVDCMNLDVAYRAFHAKKPQILYACLLVGPSRIHFPWSNVETEPTLMSVFHDLVDILPSGLADLQSLLPKKYIADIYKCYFLYKQYRTCVIEVHRLLDIFCNADPEDEETIKIKETINRDCPIDEFTEHVTENNLKSMETLRNEIYGYIQDLQYTQKQQQALQE